MKTTAVVALGATSLFASADVTSWLSYGGMGILSAVLYHLYTSALANHRDDLKEERKLREAFETKFAENQEKLVERLEKMTVTLDTLSYRFPSTVVSNENRPAKVG